MKGSRKQSLGYQIWVRFRKNRMAMVGMFIFGVILFCVIFANSIAPYGINDQDSSRRFVAPCREFLMGTDGYGRDIFSRVLYGGRITLVAGIGSTLLSAVIGVPLGAIAGYVGGRVDNLIMRALDILMSMPSLLLAITIAATMGGSLINALIAIGVAHAPALARLTRAQVMSVSNQEFIEASRKNNSSHFRIIAKHIMPNASSPIIVNLTMNVAASILMASTLSFLGLGVQPPSPEWGSMLSAGKEYLGDYWWITTMPGVVIMLSVFSINVMGDGLRDALDPKLKN